MMLGIAAVIAALAVCVHCDVYTSMNDMHTLLDTEREVIRTVENYIITQEERLQQLRRDVEEMYSVHEGAAASPEQFLGNPINAFLLIKRLTLDWADMQNRLNEDTVGQAALANLTHPERSLRWPDEEDLSGVATALVRLQDTYQLDTTQMARGYINDMPPAYRQLTASDCFELGRQSYITGDHHHTLLWMDEALERLEGSQDRIASKPIGRVDILEYLAFSHYSEGHIKQALRTTEELLEIQPEHPRAKGNKVYYEDALKEGSTGKKGEEGAIIEENSAVQEGYTVAEEVEETPEQVAWHRERSNYERLCRGEERLPEKVKATFKCFYQSGPHPYLLIGPVRAEVAHINPTITIYQRVLHQSEIDTIKSLAAPNFKRATVQNYKTGALETASYRISKSAWLREEYHPLIAKVNARIQAITGLEMETAEELQVANYGIGGHYEPHFDFARREEKDAFKSLGTGNRIATFLFYMSDVASGGATVFPPLEVALYPQQGSAAFWHNLHPSGEGDVRTRHAACPVLVGEKWVSNKWIHERGQEFRRLCDLDPMAP